VSKRIIIVIDRDRGISSVLRVIEPIIEFVFFLLIRINLLLFFFRFLLSEIIDIVSTLILFPIISGIVGIVEYRVLSEWGTRSNDS
jgi:hypothetical protein